MLSIKHVIILVVAVLLLSIGAAAFYKIFFTAHSIKIGYIFPGHVNEKGWNMEHYDAVKKACAHQGLELIYRDNVPEAMDPASRAVESLIDEGALAIIINNHNYHSAILPAIKKHPEILFLTTSKKNISSNTIPYFIRSYQAHYLAGLLAGMKSKTGNIGYLVGYNVAEAQRAVSAFTIGVRTVNREATVYVKYTNNWNDIAKQKTDAENLIKNHDVDIITGYLNTPDAYKEAAREHGIYSIGFNSRRDVNDPKELTSVVINWQKAYGIILRRIVRYFTGRIENIPVAWLGVNEDVVGIDGISSEIDPSYGIMLENARRDLIEGRDVFDGTVYDNHDELRFDKTDPVSDEALLDKFDWLVEGCEVVK